MRQAPDARPTRTAPTVPPRAAHAPDARTGHRASVSHGDRLTHLARLTHRARRPLPVVFTLLARLEFVWRSVVASGALLAARRLRRDWPILLLGTLLTALVFFLASATPQFIALTADRAAVHAVADAGSGADLRVTVPVASAEQSQATPAVPPSDIEGIGDGLRALLPAPYATPYSGTTTTVLSSLTDVETGATDHRVRFGLLTQAAEAALAPGTGPLVPTEAVGAPGAPVDTPVDVVISAAGSAATGLTTGSLFTIRGNPPQPSRTGFQPPTPSVTIRVSAVVEEGTGPAASSGALWSDEPTFFMPTDAVSTTQPGEVTVLLGPDALTRLGQASPVTFQALMRIRLDPATFTAGLLAEVAESTRQLEANNSTLVGDSPYPFVINSDFADLAGPYFDQLRAAEAQMVLVLTGLLGAGIAAMLLLGHLLAQRRLPQLLLERARGSSFAAIGARAFVEGGVVTLLAAAIGTGCSAALLPGTDGALLPVTLVAVTGLLLVPAQSLLLAGGLRRQRAEPRDRSARRAAVRVRQVRRLVLEVAVLVAAVTAATALRSRGVASQTAGPAGITDVDPLLAAAPLLLALTLAVVVVRLVPLVVGLSRLLTRGGTGALGLLASAGAGRALRESTILPLLALTLCVGLCGSGGFFTTTIDDGQATASLQRIGADARVDGPVTEADVQQAAASPGVTGAARLAIAAGSGLNLGTTTEPTTLVALDAHYADLRDAQARGPGDEGVGAATDTAGALRRLSSGAGSGEAASGGAASNEGGSGDGTGVVSLAAIVDTRTASRLVSDDIIVSVDQRNIRLHVIGTASTTPPGLRQGPSVYVDLDQLTAQLAEPLDTGVLLVDGAGAESAVALLSTPGTEVSSRTQWLARQRSLPLVTGVQQLFGASTLTFALLALVTLVATAIGGSRSRARDVSLLRTLGFEPRVGWWLAFSELLPVVLGGVAGGIAVGAGIVLLLGPALDLVSLTGGLAPPALLVPPAVVGVLAVTAVGMLGVAVFAETVFQRRNRLTDVLRVGETV